MNKIEIEKKIKELEEDLYNYKQQLKEAKNKYETVLIISDDVKKKDYDGIKDKLKEKLFEIESIEDLGLKKLAYKIQNKYDYGYYMVIKWYGDTELVTDAERYFRINDDIIKFMNVKKEEE